MQQGRIIEIGTHEELLSRGGHYVELYNTYFRHQSLENVESFARWRSTWPRSKEGRRYGISQLLTSSLDSYII